MFKFNNPLLIVQGYLLYHGPLLYIELMKFTSLAFILVVVFLDTALSAQTFERRQVAATFVENDPTLDGLLNEPEWETAPAGTGFVQFDPNVGENMTEDTEFRILYTQHSLYIGVQCFDKNPSEIITRRTVRDDSFSVDDYVYFIIDTFYDRRNAYAFSVNALGAQWDALISQNRAQDRNWDGVWHVECTINDQGWTAEIAIPFSTIDFDPEMSSWGFNIERFIGRKSEKGRWSRPEPDLRTSAPSEGGDILGFENIKPELNFEFRPYVLGKYNHVNGEDDFNWDAGADIRFRWTPALSTTLSINTDFAETEIDTPQINFTRFPLFFSEKRVFFLEDNAFYSFASSFSGSLRPFHSRRIGLSQNREIVPIVGALKTVGRSGPFQIGFMGAYLDDFKGVNSKPVFATRISRNLGDYSTLGFIGTVGDPHSNGDNFMGGFDYRYRTSELWGDKNFNLSTFILGTKTQPDGASSFSDETFGIALSFPNEPFGASFKMIELGEKFDPALGFVRRKGIRQYSSSFDYLYRTEDASIFKEFSFKYSNYLITDLNNVTETYGHGFYPLNFILASDDYLSLGVNNYNDSFDFDWYIAEDILVSAGQYDNTDVLLNIGTAVRRGISGTLSVSYGNYYGAKQFYITPNITLYPSSFIELYLYYYHSSIRSGNEVLDTHVTSNTFVFKFSPSLNWSNTVQYDNVSEWGGWNSRLNWEFKPGSHLYVVLNQAYSVVDSSIHLLQSQLATKCGLNIRF